MSDVRKYSLIIQKAAATNSDHDKTRSSSRTRRCRGAPFLPNHHSNNHSSSPSEDSSLSSSETVRLLRAEIETTETPLREPRLSIVPRETPQPWLIPLHPPYNSSTQPNHNSPPPPPPPLPYHNNNNTATTTTDNALTSWSMPPFGLRDEEEEDVHLHPPLQHPQHAAAAADVQPLELAYSQERFSNHHRTRNTNTTTPEGEPNHNVLVVPPSFDDDPSSRTTPTTENPTDRAQAALNDDHHIGANPTQTRSPPRLRRDDREEAEGNDDDMGLRNPSSPLATAASTLSAGEARASTRAGGGGKGRNGKRGRSRAGHHLRNLSAHFSDAARLDDAMEMAPETLRPLTASSSSSSSSSSPSSSSSTSASPTRSSAPPPRLPSLNKRLLREGTTEAGKARKHRKIFPCDVPHPHPPRGPLHQRLDSRAGDRGQHQNHHQFGSRPNTGARVGVVSGGSTASSKSGVGVAGPGSGAGTGSGRFRHNREDSAGLDMLSAVADASKDELAAAVGVSSDASPAYHPHHNLLSSYDNDHDEQGSGYSMPPPSVQSVRTSQSVRNQGSVSNNNNKFTTPPYLPLSQGRASYPLLHRHFAYPPHSSHYYGMLPSPAAQNHLTHSTPPPPPLSAQSHYHTLPHHAQPTASMHPLSYAHRSATDIMMAQQQQHTNYSPESVLSQQQQQQRRMRARALDAAHLNTSLIMEAAAQQQQAPMQLLPQHQHLHPPILVDENHHQLPSSIRSNKLPNDQGSQTFVTAIAVGSGDKMIQASASTKNAATNTTHTSTTSTSSSTTNASTTFRESNNFLLPLQQQLQQQHHRKMSSYSSIGALLNSNLFSNLSPHASYGEPLLDNRSGHHRKMSSTLSFLDADLRMGLESTDDAFMRNLQASVHAAGLDYGTNNANANFNVNGVNMSPGSSLVLAPPLLPSHPPLPPPPPTPTPTPPPLVHPLQGKSSESLLREPPEASIVASSADATDSTFIVQDPDNESESETENDEAGSKLASGGTSKRLRRKCTVAGCSNRVVQGGLCISHGAKRKICKHPGCNKNVKKAGLCSTHGPARKRCSHPECTKVAVQGGRCIAHGAKKRLCLQSGCTKQAILNGMCKKHHDQIKSQGGYLPFIESDVPICLPVPKPEMPVQQSHTSSHTRGLSFFHEISADAVSNLLNVESSPIRSAIAQHPGSRGGIW